MPKKLTQSEKVSKQELLELADWEKKYIDATRAASEAERQLDALRLALAEKVLGIKTSDELKALSPTEVQKRFAQRLTRGLWAPERGAPVFVFAKYHEGRYPAWARLFAQKSGETAAAHIKANTPISYSYRVEVGEI